MGDLPNNSMPDGEAPQNFDEPLEEMAKKILQDGIIDADEVKQLRERIYADGVVDGDEAELLFYLNDATSAKANDPSWKELFVEALGKYLIKDETVPRSIDGTEAEWLIRRIEQDGKLDENERALLNHLAHAAFVPGQSSNELKVSRASRERWRQFSDSASLIRALHVIMDVFQMAGSPNELYRSAARGAIDLIELDAASVFVYEHGKWRPAVTLGENCRETSKEVDHVLAAVQEEKRTIWENAGRALGDPNQADGASSLVVSPILNGDASVIAAICGERFQFDTSNDEEITGMDAMLVELLACGVASGLARMSQEDTTRRLRTQFEQFFTPELARRIEADQQLLEGRDVDVTILFCDVREFSRISERMDASVTFDWMHDVLTVLSECVIAQQGVLVDYVGDELMAMWGAPDTQPDHANRAFLAAIDMLSSLGELNDRWESRLNCRFDLGIGINSGRVRAGNAGSRRKFKYGPRGNAVNLASRVTGATKFLKCRLLLTGSTVERLNGDFPLRCIGQVRVVNVTEAVTLYDLPRQTENIWQTISSIYESALAAFVDREFHRAADLLGHCLSNYPDDGPSLILLHRVVEAMVEGPSPLHPVWELPGK